MGLRRSWVLITWIGVTPLFSAVSYSQETLKSSATNSTPSTSHKIMPVSGSTGETSPGNTSPGNTSPGNGVENPQIGTITLPVIEMRSGPTLKYPPAGKLHKGERINIHHEVDQWYAILPPPDSVSWVNHRFLGDFDPKSDRPQNAVIMKDQVIVRLGSSVEIINPDNEAPILPVSQVKLKLGSQVKIVGAKRKFEGSTWYPIASPIGEYRFIPKFAVDKQKLIQKSRIQPLRSEVVKVTQSKSTTSNSGNNNSDTMNSTASNERIAATTIPANLGAKIDHPLWRQAEQYHQQGKFVEAEKLYIQIYQELKEKRADLDDLLTCFNRIDDCKTNIRRNGIARKPDLSTSSPRRQPPPLPFNNTTTALAPPNGTSTEEMKNLSQQLLKSTDFGILRKSAFYIDDKPAFALVKSNGDLMYYLTPGKNKALKLDRLVGRYVKAYGAEKVRGDVRGAPWMMVEKVQVSEK